MKVAIVDDQILFGEVLQALVTSHPLVKDVTVFNSGQDFSQANESFDLLLIDLNMPEESGFEVAEKAKKNNKHLKVCVISVRLDLEAIHKAMDQKVNGYVPKTVGREELFKAVNALAQGQIYLAEDVRRIIREKTSEYINANNFDLSAREYEVLRLICQQKSTLEIAEMLQVSRNTVDNHRHKINQKLGTNNLVQVAMYGASLED